MQLSPEEFKEWLQLPATEWVFAAMKKAAEAQKSDWAEIQWINNEVDPALLLEARVRADCYLALPMSSYEDWSAINDPED